MKDNFFKSLKDNVKNAFTFQDEDDYYDDDEYLDEEDAYAEFYFTYTTSIWTHDCEDDDETKERIEEDAAEYFKDSTTIEYEIEDFYKQSKR